MDTIFGTDGRTDAQVKAISLSPTPTSDENKLKLNK